MFVVKLQVPFYVWSYQWFFYFFKKNYLTSSKLYRFYLCCLFFFHQSCFVKIHLNFFSPSPYCFDEWFFDCYQRLNSETSMINSQTALDIIYMSIIMSLVVRPSNKSLHMIISFHCDEPDTWATQQQCYLSINFRKSLMQKVGKNRRDKKFISWGESKRCVRLKDSLHHGCFLGSKTIRTLR